MPLFTFPSGNSTEWAKMTTVAAAGFLWGCYKMNFKTKLPFYGMV
jgi:hypothetical protein